MGLFDFLKMPDINAGVKEFEENKDAVLIDVREVDEFKQGHIGKAVNVPLSTLNKVTNVVKDKNTPLYVYCLSGSRSSQAVAMMKGMGYTNAKNIGGIGSYQGVIER